MGGLEQYNEVGTLERLGVGVSEAPAAGQAGWTGGVEAEDAKQAQRSARIVEALSEKNHPRTSQTPYISITLSLIECAEMIERGATYQPPVVCKLSESGKARAKKRDKKALALQANDLVQQERTSGEGATS